MGEFNDAAAAVKLINGRRDKNEEFRCRVEEVL